MRIGIDLYGESILKAGTGRYSTEVIRNLLSIDTQNEYYIFQPKNLDGFVNSGTKNVEIVSGHTSSNTISRRIYEQLILPLQLKHFRIDYVLSTNNVGVILYGRKAGLIIHDLARWKSIGTGNFFVNSFLKILLTLSVKFCRDVITISNQTVDDLEKLFKKTDGTVIPEGINLDLFKPIKRESVEKVLEKYKLDYKKYIFLHSTIEERKNHIRLIEAFSSFESDLKLVFAGKPGYGHEKVIKKINDFGLDGKVIILGFISDSDLLALLNGSLFFAFPSLFEGAGLPPIEAMACGIPTLVSDIPSIREYVQDNALYVDPQNVESIQEGLKKMYSDKRLRMDLAEKGLKHVQNFSWEKHARKILEIVNKL